jgi:DNA-binding XRE family transcriptional regulator
MLKQMINGQQLRKIRKEAGYSQEQLGLLLGLTRETINKIENNNPGSIESLAIGKVQDWWQICSVKISKVSQRNFKQYILNLFN